MKHFNLVYRRPRKSRLWINPEWSFWWKDNNSQWDVLYWKFSQVFLPWRKSSPFCDLQGKWYWWRCGPDGSECNSSRGRSHPLRSHQWYSQLDDENTNITNSGRNCKGTWGFWTSSPLFRSPAGWSSFQFLLPRSWILESIQIEATSDESYKVATPNHLHSTHTNGSHALEIHFKTGQNSAFRIVFF